MIVYQNPVTVSPDQPLGPADVHGHRVRTRRPMPYQMSGVTDTARHRQEWLNHSGGEQSQGETVSRSRLTGFPVRLFQGSVSPEHGENTKSLNKLPAELKMHRKR